MSRPLHPAVPAPLRALLEADPGDPAVDGFTLLLLTPREDGWPHQAMLSVGEVACEAQPDRMRLAVWPRSTSTQNMRARERATLTAVVDGVSYALFLAIEDVRDLSSGLVRFDARVTAVTADEAPYARLESGVRFTLNEPDEVLARWRATRAELVA